MLLLVKTKVACLEQTIETTLLVTIINNNVLFTLEIVLEVSIFSIKVVKEVVDKCLEERITRFLNALHFFYFFSSYYSSK